MPNTKKNGNGKNAEDVKETRSKRAADETASVEEGQEKIRASREVRKSALEEENTQRRQKQIDLAGDAEDEDEKDVTLHDGKPGSGAGLKPGDWHAPENNPGAAARVPSQPLQPESLQSHGMGILYDKDLDNPPYGDDDPELVDEGPSGSRPRTVDKAAEREKAETSTARMRQYDPDNPTRGAKGKDATASPDPIGSRGRSKTNVSGGSNSGVDDSD